MTTPKHTVPVSRPPGEQTHAQLHPLSDPVSRLDWVLALMGVGTWTSEYPGQRPEWDAQTRRLFFIAPDAEPTVDLFRSRLHPDDREPTRLAIENAIRDRGLCTIDHRAVDPATGETRWIRSVGQATCAADGAPVRFDGISYDITDCKRAEQALRENEETARRQSTEIAAMYGSPHFGFCVLDEKLRYVRVNDLFAEINGVAASEHLGKTVREVVGDRADEIEAVHRRAFETGRPVLDVEFAGTTPSASGVPRTWIQQWLPIKDSAGAVTVVNVIAHEITGYKQAEQVLRQSEERFRLLAETSPAAIVIYQEGRFIYANPAAESITGYGRDELLAQELSSVAHPDYRQRVETMVSRRARGDALPAYYELKIITKDGRERWLDLSSVSIPYGSGPAGLVVAFDITERKQAEERLRVKDSAIACSLNAIAIADLDGRITYVNPSFLKLWGFADEGEVLGGSVLDFWKERHEARPVVEAVRQTGGWRGELAAVNKAGEDLSLYLSASLVRGDAGDPICMMASFLDITDRKRAEDILRRLNETLEQRVRDRTAQLHRKNRQLQQRAEQLSHLASELTLAEQRQRHRFARVLHDQVQQLLSAAKLQVQLLGERVANGHDKCSIDMICGLIDDCLAASRNLTGELSSAICHEAGLAEALEWLTRWMEEKHGLAVELDAEGDASCDREDMCILLFESVRELLFNVVKHSGVRCAKVTIRRLDAHLEITVSDEGAGFDPVQLRTNRKLAGGFGLFTIRERLELLGGTMNVESAPGRGARFTLIAPVVDSANAAPTTEQMDRTTGPAAGQSQGDS